MRERLGDLVTGERVRERLGEWRMETGERIFGLGNGFKIYEMKRLFWVVILILGISQLQAQNQSDSISVKKAFGTIFKQNGKVLTPGKLMSIVQSNPSAFEEMKVAKSNYGVGSVIGFAGGFMVGYPIGTALAGGKADWALAGIGAGLIVASIPFSSAYVSHAKKAVKMYNAGLKQTGMDHVSYQLGLAANGIGLKIWF